jgi:hypothetical protein
MMIPAIRNLGFFGSAVVAFSTYSLIKIIVDRAFAYYKAPLSERICVWNQRYKVALYNDKGEKIDLSSAAKSGLHFRAKAVIERELTRDPRVETLQCPLKKRWFSKLPAGAIMKIVEDTAVLPKSHAPLVDATMRSHLSWEELESLSFQEAFEAIYMQWESDPHGSLLLKAIQDKHQKELEGASMEVRDGLLLCYLMKYEKSQPSPSFIFHDSLTFLIDKAEERRLFENEELKRRFSSLQNDVRELISSREALYRDKKPFSVSLLKKLCSDTNYFPYWEFHKLSSDQKKLIRNALIICFKNQGSKTHACSSQIYDAFERYAPHDREFWEAFIECHYNQPLPPSFQKDKALLTLQLKAALSKTSPFFHPSFISIPDHYKGHIDRELALLIVKRHGPSIHYLAPVFRKDEEIRREACRHWTASCNNHSLYNQITSLVETDPLFLETFLQHAPLVAINACMANFRGKMKGASILELFVRRGGSLEKIAPALRSIDLSLLAIDQDGLQIRHVTLDPRSPEFRECAKSAVMQNGFALYYLPDFLKDDPEIAALAMRQNSRVKPMLGARLARMYADEKVPEEIVRETSSKEYVEHWILCAKTDPFLNAGLEYKRQKGISDPVLIFQSFEPYIHNTQDPRLYLEYIVILNTMKLRKGHPFAQVSLRNDLPSVIRESAPYYRYLLRSGLPLNEFPPHCIEIESFMLEVFARKNPEDVSHLMRMNYFQRFTEGRNRELADNILQRDPNAVFFLPVHAHLTSLLLLDGRVIRWLKDPTDEQITIAIQSHPLAYSNLSPSLQAKRDWAFLALTRERFAELTEPEKRYLADQIYFHHHNDLEVIEAILDVYPEYFNALYTLQENKRIAAYGVERDGSALEHVGASLQDDKEIVLKAVRNFGPACLFASADLQIDPEVMTAALQNPLQWTDSRTPRSWFRPESCALLIEKAPQLLAVRWLSSADYPVRLAAVKRNGYLLNWIVGGSQSKELVAAAVRQNPQALKFATYSFRKDPDIKRIAAGAHAATAAPTTRNNVKEALTAIAAISCIAYKLWPSK